MAAQEEPGPEQRRGEPVADGKDSPHGRESRGCLALDLDREPLVPDDSRNPSPRGLRLVVEGDHPSQSMAWRAALLGAAGTHPER